jgi:D-cysteine desulfhydrase
VQGASTAERALLRRFSQCAPALPYVRLCDLPTPVVRAEKLELETGTGPLYVKRDDASALPYGGNKPRKLEWVLGSAQAQGRSRVMTFGGLGTNHGLATALYAVPLGFACDLVLVDQPIDDKVRVRLREMHAAGARLQHGRTVAGTALRAVRNLARHPRTLILPAGGSSPLGVLGFVDAGLELGEQIGRGELPEPARVYVPLGTGGTVAGLAAGFALAGVRARVVGVLVTDILPPTTRRLDRMARRALRRLARAGAPVEPDSIELDVEIETGHVGGGYGHPTETSRTACALAERLEGLHLDTTYTGKTLGALLARERGEGVPVLFWNTYSGRAPGLPLPDPSGLPAEFRTFFERPRTSDP